MEQWDQGFPITGIETTNGSGSMVSWDSGFHFNTIFPPSSFSLIKARDGLILASIKTIDGLALANVKSINGLSNI